MRLSQCIATHDKYFDNTIVNFSPQVTLLCGPARSGKSFLMFTLIESLYADSPFSGAETKSLVLNITFEDGGSQYRILRDSSKSACIRLHGNAPFNSAGLCRDDLLTAAYIFSPADHHLQETEIHFEKFVPVFLNDKEHYCDKGKYLAEILSDKARFRLIRSAKEESAYIAERSRLLKEIEIREIKDGKIGKLEQEKRELGVEIAEHSTKRNAIADSMRQLESLRLMVEEYNAMKQLRLRLVEQKDEEISKDLEIRHLKRDLRKNYPRFFGISSDLRKSISKINELYEIVKTITEREELFTKKSSRGIRTVLTTSVAVVLSTAAVFLLNIFYPLLPLLTAIIGAGSFSGLILLLTILRILHFRRAYSTDGLEDEKAGTEEAIISELAKNNIEMSDVRGKEIYNFVVHYLNEYGYFCEREDEIRDKTDEIEELYKRKTDDEIMELDENLENFALKIREFSVQIGFENVNPDNFDYDEYRREREKQISEIDAESNRLETIIRRIDEEITDFTPASPDRIDERLTHVDTQITRARLSIKSLFYLSDAVNEVVKQESAFFREKLSAEIMKTLMLLGVSESQERINSFLNGAKIDDNPSLRQLFLIALKTSLGNCCDNIIFPLIFDEPAVFMDKKTVVLFSDLIKNISETRQVIILTHDPDQFSFANRVILR